MQELQVQIQKLRVQIHVLGETKTTIFKTKQTSGG